MSQAPPPPKAAASFAPPPRGPPKTATPIDTAVNSSPTVQSAGGGFALSREPSRQGFTAPSGQPMAKVMSHPPGSRDHIPPQDLPIYQGLTAELQRVQASAPEKYRRPLEDSDRRLNVLFDQINNGVLGEPILAKLRHITQLLAQKDFANAYRTNMELTASSMDECREWITGLKTLITVGKILG